MPLRPGLLPVQAKRIPPRTADIENDVVYLARFQTPIRCHEHARPRTFFRRQPRRSLTEFVSDLFCRGLIRKQEDTYALEYLVNLV